MRKHSPISCELDQLAVQGITEREDIENGLEKAWKELEVIK